MFDKNNVPRPKAGITQIGGDGAVDMTALLPALLLSIKE
jgi:hypothetical protein